MSRKAEADAAYEIQQQEQRKTIEITTADANIAKQEKEIELREKEIAVKGKKHLMQISVNRQKREIRNTAEG